MTRRSAGGLALGIVGTSVSPAFASPWPLAAALFVLAFGVAFVIAYVYGQRMRASATAAEPELPILGEAREREALAEELEREMEAAEPLAEEPAPEAMFPTAPAAAPVPEDRAARLRAAYQAGRISKEAYEANLARLGPAVEAIPFSAPEPAPEAAPAPPSDVAAKVARLTSALEAGRLSRDAYEANLRKLGVASVAEAPAASEEDARKGKVERIRRMYAEGRIPRAVYEGNLRKLGVETEAEREPEELAPEEIPPEVPAPGPTVEERVAKLRAAYEANRMSRAAYEANLRKLGVEPEPEAAPPAVDRVARLHEAYAAGRLSRDLYVRNVRALGGEPVPEPAAEPMPVPAAPPARAEPTVEEKVARLRAAYEAGRLPRSAYEGNLRRLGVEPEPIEARAPEELPPVPAAPVPPTPSPEEKAAKLHEAYKAGRLTRALYERNVRALGVALVPEPAPEHVPPPPAAPAPPPAPARVPPPVETPEARLAKMRAAFAAGRISREAYVANATRLGFDVRALGLEMKVEAPVPRPVLSREERLGRMHVAYRAGRMPRELYVKNVTALGGAPIPEPAKEPPPPPPRALSNEERIAKITEGYRAGRIHREAYERNVRALGGTPEPAPAPIPPPTPTPVAVPPAPVNPPATTSPSTGERAARLREAFEAGRITKEAFQANLAKLGVAPPPPPAEVVNPPAPAPEAARAPADLEARIEVLTSMFVNGKISRAVLEKNLARAYEGMDPRLPGLRLALAEGRIPRDVYDANVRRLRGEQGVK